MSFFCSLFGYTKQAFYKSHAGYEERNAMELKAKIAVLSIRRIMPRLGTRKLHYLLREPFRQQGIKVGRQKLFSILRSDGLLVARKKKYTITTDSRHWMHKYPNRIKDTAITRPEQVWAADITYLDTHSGNAYLHLVTDVYSKKVMGYELCNNMEATSTLKALQMALSNRKYPDQPLIHHSDRGLQYCSKVYIDALLGHKVSISMTENGDPYENAVAERVNGILKDEFALGDTMDGLEQAKDITRQSIDIYNTFRPHLSCKMLTPSQMHQQQSVMIKTWKKKTQPATTD